MAWNYSLTYTRPDNTTGSVIGGRESLEDTIRALEKDRLYYLSKGYTVAVDGDRIEEICPDCQGQGRRQHARNRFKQVECKRCHGRGVLFSMPFETASA